MLKPSQWRCTCYKIAPDRLVGKLRKSRNLNHSLRIISITNGECFMCHIARVKETRNSYKMSAGRRKDVTSETTGKNEYIIKMEIG
jgi:hypothetical protein